MALLAGTGEGDSDQGLHRAERGTGRILRLGKLVCAIGEQRRCAGFNAFVHGYSIGGAGDHADMPCRVPEAQPLVSDEADEGEAFAPLALGKKVIAKAPDFGRLFYGAGRRWENGYRKSGRASFKEHAVEVVAYGKVPLYRRSCLTSLHCSRPPAKFRES